MVPAPSPRLRIPSRFWRPLGRVFASSRHPTRIRLAGSPSTREFKNNTNEPVKCSGISESFGPSRCVAQDTDIKGLSHCVIDSEGLDSRTECGTATGRTRPRLGFSERAVWLESVGGQACGISRPPHPPKILGGTKPISSVESTNVMGKMAKNEAKRTQPQPNLRRSETPIRLSESVS